MKIQSIAYYTRFVNLAKLFLGILVLTLTGSILFYPAIKKNSGIRIALIGSSDKNTPSPTQMINANFHGFDENNQPYNITAKTALQVDENNVAFEHINGDITLNSGLWLTTQSDKGSLKIKERLLYLTGNVEMFTDEGYELHTQSMNIDIGAKIAVTSDPVNGHGPLGTIRSNGAVFNGNNKTALFGKPVFVTIRLPPKEEPHK